MIHKFISVVGAVRGEELGVIHKRRSAWVCGWFAAAAITGALPAYSQGLNLGTLSNYALVDLGNNTTLGMNSGPIEGDVLLGNGVKAAFSGGNSGEITGTLYYDSTVTGTNTFSQLQTAPTTSLVNTSVTAQALATANGVAAYAAALTPTLTFANITNTTTINGNGGLNVIDVANIHNAPLTLSGSANDVFVFNVSGTFQTNQTMTLTGGVTASHILFNFTGTSGDVLQTSGGNSLYGTFLAADGGSFQFSELNLDGAEINTGGNIQFVSGSKDGFVPFTSAPEVDPASAGAALTLLAGVLAVLRGRRQQA